MINSKSTVELKIATHEDHLNTPASAPEIADEANKNFVDLTIDAVENACLTELLDFLEEF